MTTTWFSRLQSSLAPRMATSSSSRRRAHSLRNRPRFESLEDRQMLSAVYTVSNTLDSGPGSLRQAILNSDANPPVSQTYSNGSATTPFNIIEFSIPVGSTISPLSALPAITQPVEIFAPVSNLTRRATSRRPSRSTGRWRVTGRSG